MSVPGRYAVAGNPVAHSESPFIHAAFAQATGEPVEYERLLCPMDAFASTVRAFAEAGASGCNVTLPFKHEAYALCSRHTVRAELAGACNTLRFDAHEGWLGDNTDGAGLLRDVERNAGCSLQGARVLLVGAGGGAAGVLGPLASSGAAEVVVANRTLARARARWSHDRHSRLLVDNAPGSSPRRSKSAVKRSTSSSTPARAASAARRCRSPHAYCGQARSPST